MEKYFAINQDGQSIRCKLYYEKNHPMERIIVSVHGFAGHKDNAACKRFAERVLTKYKGVGVLSFDLPYHGEDVKKKLVLKDCLSYLHTVAAYCKDQLQAEKLYAYATSFGGFLVLRYLLDFGNPFERIALRCPAINMAESLTRRVMKQEELEKLLKGKNVCVGFDRKVEITRSFLTELQDADIGHGDFLDYAENILILHGTKDEIVPFEESQRFADDQLMEFVPVENADHRFQNPACMELATKAVLSFFSL